MKGTLPLLRTRLELDRGLRQRSFFARALNGELTRWEYRDLLTQLHALAGSVDPSNDELNAAARSDAAALGGGSADDPGAPDVCVAARMLGHASRDGAPELCARDVTMAVLGTSWTADASARLGDHFPAATGLLSLLRARGAQSLRELERALEADDLDPRATYVFAEMVRGAFLGLATHLETTWPAPVSSLSTNAFIGEAP